jgi:hypothetical protein
MRFSDQVPPLIRPERPTGLYVLTIWDGILLGILPLLSTVFGLVRNGVQNTNAFSIYLVAGLSALIITVSIGTFVGNDRSRAALIYLVTIYESLQAFNSVILLASGNLPAADQLYSIGRIMWAVFWIALHVWYLLKPSTLEFFRYPKNTMESQ